MNVRLLRVFRSMTQLELAKAVSASEAAIWQTERGREPSDTLRDALAIVLKVEPEFFYDRIADEFTEADCHFRKGQSSAERIRKRVLAQASLFGHVVSSLRQAWNLKLPTYNVPALTATNAAEIERAAEDCRLHWDLRLDGPIVQMGRVLENAGVMLTRLRDDESAKLDAFSHRGIDGEMSYVVLNPAKESSSRARYDMAHELAHLVFDHKNELSQDARERRADKFAAAFLLPLPVVKREFLMSAGRIRLEHVLELKKRWKVSAQAIVYRAYDLHLIDAVEFRRVYKLMSSKGWIKGEPSEPPAESPELFRKTVQTLWQRKKLGAPRFAADLHWSVGTFEDVTGLRSSAPAETTEPSNVVSLSDRRQARA